jgi:hypothetical protein
LYIKDVFFSGAGTSSQQMENILAFNKMFFYNAISMAQVAEYLSTAGFKAIECKNLASLASTSAFSAALWTSQKGRRTLSEFGRAHYPHHTFHELPLTFGQISSLKE